MARIKAPEWGVPEEVPVIEMGTVANRTARQEFMRDLWLRLERTRADRALRYMLADEAHAEELRKYIASQTRKAKGNGQLCLSKRKLEDGRVAVYVARGPNYKQGVPE